MLALRSADRSRQFLQIRLGPRAVVRDHFGSANRAKLEALRKRVAADVAEEEARREEIARAGGVDDLGDRLGIDLGALAAGHRDRTFGAAGYDEHGHLAR